MEAITRRFLNGETSYGAIEFARIRAEDHFEVKVDICREMSSLAPEQPWLERGARALENPRTATGAESLERLYSILNDLRERGRESASFKTLQAKFL